MSDLRISYDGLTIPPQACTEPPPEPHGHGSRLEDHCSVTLPLVEEGHSEIPPQAVRFDRMGDQFILSPTNSLEIREWFQGHSNLPQLLNTVRLTGSLMQVPHLDLSEENLKIFLIIAQYVVNGTVRVNSRGSLSEDQTTLGYGLLTVFADSSDRVLAPILGQLQIARRSTWLSPEALERIRWITSMLDLVPRFRSFRSQFIGASDIQNWDRLPPQRWQLFSQLSQFLGEVVLDYASGRPIRYRQSFLQAYDAYQGLYQEEIRVRRRPDFCSVLQRGLEGLEGRSSAGRQFLQECQAILRFRRMSPEEALRRSLRDTLRRPESLRGLRQSIAEESEEANMSLQWLMHRGSREDGRIGEVWEILLRSIRIQFPAEEDANPNLSLDVSRFIRECNHLAEGDLLHRREYFLAILAVLRHLFGASGAPPSIRAFVRDNYRQVSWNLSARSLEQLRRFLTQVERRRLTSQERTDTLLPWLLGSACVAGAAGVTLTELLTDRRDQEGLHLGLGTGSAAIGGGGCLGLAGHYVWPEIFEVRNHWLWDGITTGVGSLVGAGLFYFLHLIFPQGPDTRRFPVDEYGP